MTFHFFKIVDISALFFGISPFHKTLESILVTKRWIKESTMFPNVIIATKRDNESYNSPRVPPRKINTIIFSAFTEKKLRLFRTKFRDDDPKNPSEKRRMSRAVPDLRRLISNYPGTWPVTTSEFRHISLPSREKFSVKITCLRWVSLFFNPLAD